MLHTFIDNLSEGVTAIKGFLIASGAAVVLGQTITPDFIMPSWAKDSIGMAALFFLGWLLLQERKENRAAMLTAQKEYGDRIEAIYKSRIDEAREYSLALDSVRREQHEHTQRLYQDLITFATEQRKREP